VCRNCAQDEPKDESRTSTVPPSRAVTPAEAQAAAEAHPPSQAASPAVKGEPVAVAVPVDPVQDKMAKMKRYVGHGTRAVLDAVCKVRHYSPL
jgi:hypothetical protein